jgi:hypothetical protein
LTLPTDKHQLLLLAVLHASTHLQLINLAQPLQLASVNRLARQAIWSPIIHASPLACSVVSQCCMTLLLVNTHCNCISSVPMHLQQSSPHPAPASILPCCPLSCPLNAFTLQGEFGAVSAWWRLSLGMPINRNSTEPHHLLMWLILHVPQAYGHPTNVMYVMPACLCTDRIHACHGHCRSGSTRASAA